MAGDVSVRGTKAYYQVSIHARVWRATQMYVALIPIVDVSIHARVWRATVKFLVLIGASTVSIHARVWRATRSRVALKKATKFQSTPAYGGRLNVFHFVTLCSFVSIHARVWRATLSTLLHDFELQCFNPRPRMAGDKHAYCYYR